MSTEGLYRKYNLMDLAQVPLKHGSIVPGQLLRSGSLDAMTAEDWAEINHLYPLGILVDLRQKEEIPVLPALYRFENREVTTRCAWVNIPLQGLNYLMEPRRQSNPKPKDWKRARKFLWSDPKVNLPLMYRRMLDSEENASEWRRFFNLAVAPRNGGMLWHCAQGTDRTGLTAAFVLELLGASRVAILDNYEKCMVHSDMEGFETIALEEVLAYLDSTEGGVTGYLEHKIGLTSEYRQAFVRKFSC